MILLANATILNFNPTRVDKNTDVAIEGNKIIAIGRQLSSQYPNAEAIDLQEKYQFSFWDCLVIQAAIQGKARILLSEDLPDGQVVKNLKILNPFTKEWKDFL